MMALRQRSTGDAVTLGQVLGRGGQGTVYTIPTNHLIAAKVYHRNAASGSTSAQDAKLRIMLAHPPAGAPTLSAPPKGHIPFAWPVDLLLDERGNCAGFLMPRLDVTQAVLLRDVYHPGERRRAFPQCSWKDLVHICANLASVVAVVHQTERYVVGDLNESNILVVRDSKLVTFVDCDSIQARGDEGEIMLCPVGKSEYLAPELQGKPLTVVARNKSHDAFSLAVMIFLMLMQGVHPFDGTWADDTTSRREDKITRGAWPYDPNNILRCQPRPNTLPLSFLPPNIVQLTQRCFLQGLRHPELRPSAKEWHRELLAAEQRLRQCPTNRAHYYGKHLSECPWCQQTKIKGEDPFPGTAGNLFASFSLRRLWPGSGQR